MMMAMTRPLTRPSATLSPLRGARGNAGRVAQRGRGQQGPKFPLAPRERGEGGQRPGEGRVILSRVDGEGPLRHVHGSCTRSFAVFAAQDDIAME